MRWQVKKAVPFPLEQAQISWTRGAADVSGAVELIVAVARRDIVADYESACTAAGLQPGLVDLATFNIANAVLAGGADAGAEAADWLLVHVAPDSISIAVLRGGDLVLFRNRPSDGEGNLADFVHQTAMYYEDRLGGTRSGACVRGAAATPPPGRRPGGGEPVPGVRGARRSPRRRSRRARRGGDLRPHHGVARSAACAGGAGRRVAARAGVLNHALRTNLATRPFYNERLVHVLLGVALALIVAFTLFNATQLIGLSRTQAERSTAASRDERAPPTSRAAPRPSGAASTRRPSSASRRPRLKPTG